MKQERTFYYERFSLKITNKLQIHAEKKSKHVMEKDHSKREHNNHIY